MQGHHDAGDQLHVKTRELLAGVDRAAKIIDDLMLMPRSLTDAYRDGALVLQSAISKNFKFSAEKFLISPQVTFSELSLSSSPSGDVVKLPDMDQISEFINLKSPTTEEESQSLLGLLATFHKWQPDIAKDTTHMRQLLMKGVNFNGMTILTARNLRTFKSR